MAVRILSSFVVILPLRGASSYSTCRLLRTVAHVALITRAVLRELDIQEMEWPAVSPDLNPIEHVWDRFNRSFHRRPVPPQTLEDLEQALIEE